MDTSLPDLYSRLCRTASHPTIYRFAPHFRWHSVQLMGLALYCDRTTTLGLVTNRHPGRDQLA